MNRSLVLTLVAGGAFAATACTVHTYPEPVGYAEVTAAPVNIEAYPSTVYEGRPVYLYEGRWYYRDGGRWGYYRNEPPPLRDYRVHVQRPYVQQAPPAYDRDYRRDRRPYAPPPAVPVR